MGVHLDHGVGAIVVQSGQRRTGTGRVRHGVAILQIVVQEIAVGVGERHRVGGEIDPGERIEHQRHRSGRGRLGRIGFGRDPAVHGSFDVGHRHTERQRDPGRSAVVGRGLDVGLVGVARFGRDLDVAGRDDLGVLGGDGVGGAVGDIDGARERRRRLVGGGTLIDLGLAGGQAREHLGRRIRVADVLRDAGGARHGVLGLGAHGNIAAVQRARVDAGGAFDVGLGAGLREIEGKGDADMGRGVEDRLAGGIAARLRGDVDVARGHDLRGPLQGDAGVGEAHHDRHGQAHEVVERPQHRLDGPGEDRAVPVELLVQLADQVVVDRLRSHRDVATHQGRAVDGDRRDVADRRQVVRDQVVEHEVGGRRFDRDIPGAETVVGLGEQLGAAGDVDGVILAPEQESAQRTHGGQREIAGITRGRREFLIGARCGLARRDDRIGADMDPGGRDVERLAVERKAAVQVDRVGAQLALHRQRCLEGRVQILDRERVVTQAEVDGERSQRHGEDRGLEAAVATEELDLAIAGIAVVAQDCAVIERRQVQCDVVRCAPAQADRLQPRIPDLLAIEIDGAGIGTGGREHGLIQDAAIEFQGVEAAGAAVDQARDAARRIEYEGVEIAGGTAQVLDVAEADVVERAGVGSVDVPDGVGIGPAQRVVARTTRHRDPYRDTKKREGIRATEAIGNDAGDTLDFIAESLGDRVHRDVDDRAAIGGRTDLIHQHAIRPFGQIQCQQCFGADRPEDVRRQQQPWLQGLEERPFGEGRDSWRRRAPRRKGAERTTNQHSEGLCDSHAVSEHLVGVMNNHSQASAPARNRDSGKSKDACAMTPVVRNSARVPPAQHHGVAFNNR